MWHGMPYQRYTCFLQQQRQRQRHPLFVINFNIAKHYKRSSANFKVCCEANNFRQTRQEAGGVGAGLGLGGGSVGGVLEWARLLGKTHSACTRVYCTRETREMKGNVEIFNWNQNQNWNQRAEQNILAPSLLLQLALSLTLCLSPPLSPSVSFFTARSRALFRP